MQGGSPGYHRLRGSIGRRIKRWVATCYHHARFRLSLFRRYNQLTVETVGETHLIVLPDVFNPKLMITGEAFVRTLDRDAIPAGARVLELGTGTGIGALRAATLGAQVTAVDVNPEAARCARANAVLNGLEDSLRVEQGDLFGPVAGETFDVVLFHPPFFDGQPRTDLEYAWKFDDVPERFAAALGDHLRPGGYALLFLSTAGSCDRYLDALAAKGFIWRVVTERDLWFETVALYRIEREQDAGTA